MKETVLYKYYKKFNFTEHVDREIFPKIYNILSSPMTDDEVDYFFDYFEQNTAYRIDKYIVNIKWDINPRTQENCIYLYTEGRGLTQEEIDIINMELNDYIENKARRINNYLKDQLGNNFEEFSFDNRENRLTAKRY